MCYYNRLIVPQEQVFDLDGIPVAWEEGSLVSRPLQSGFEYSDWPIIIWSSKRNIPVGIRAHWEFFAPWLKNRQAIEASRQQYTTLNAVGENLFTSKLYKDAVVRRRCLIPSSGFYEWRHFKGEGQKKEQAYPYFVSVRETPVFFMAGLCQGWTDTETGEYLIGFAIVTTKANRLMEYVHNKKKRMPLILPPALAGEWLNPSTAEDKVKELTAFQYPESQMQAYTLVKDFRQQLDPLQQFTYSELPEIVL
ncbi:SOS response-associated peptidase [Flavihumibacter petaseus]|uniref:Abasic site processing protein n=1 Tax=Flavihumibacter petaseus NBRC 106054 TaxID=1220578 RepID=A0A0E9N1Z0_9BACT|nr:SOS response-associated peptidase [Flavihumibacter petaseus]GAO43651.1 hypothetical protein FPE01S_02_07570 [Flavihumibacter petaseus NBRC 106054]